MSLPWFKHYNNAHEGQLIGDLLAQKEYDAVALFYILMELISRFEDPETRGRASIPLDRIARAMNMKPSRTDRLLTRISLVSRSDLICETDEKQPRNRVFLMRNWLKFQETRGGKREAKSEQKRGRSKKIEVRSKKEDIYISSLPDEVGVPHGVSLGGEQGTADEGNFTSEDLASLWNESAPHQLPRVIQPLSEKRKAATRRALKAHPELEFWQDVISVIAQSKFLTGDVGVSVNRSKPWRCNYDWLIKGDNAIKVIEGSYS